MNMENAINLDGKDYLKDVRGSLVPLGAVKEIDVLRNNLVLEIFSSSLDISRQLKEFKDKIMGDVKAFVALSADKYGVKWGGKKGNISLTSFDGEYKIMLAVQETITFDERLQVAKELIDKCILKWGKDANTNLMVLVTDAFKVNKEGNVDTKRILGLKRYNIDDPDWLHAMDAIADSLSVSCSKEYIRIYRRINDDKYTQVLLDLASV